MKVSLQKVDKGNEEIIIKYHDMTPEITEVIKLLSGSDSRLSGTKEDGGQVYYFAPENVFYFESVEGMVYAYLEREVYRLKCKEKLDEIAYQYSSLGIIKCARTMAVNLYKIEWLKSQPGGRIMAALQNGEKIIISRKYAGLLRKEIKGSVR